jgi:maltose O-acetyltransferase
MKNLPLYLHQKYWDLIYYSFRKKYKLPKDFRFTGTGTIFYGEGAIDISKNSYVGRNCYFQAKKGFRIDIGKKVSISHNVYIYTSNKITGQDFSIGDLSKKCGNVSIGAYTWIGAFVFIKEGVTIGENSVIGAHSVVTKDIPPNCIAVGNPCRVIKNKS